MSTRAAIRRRVAGIIAPVVAGSALALVPINIGAADATSTPQAAAMSWLNEDRVSGAGKNAFLDNGYLDDWAQGVAAKFVSCGGCANPDYPAWVLGTHSDFTISYAEASGGTLASRPGRIVTDFEQYDSSAAFTTSVYGAIGIVTSGSTSYGVLVTINFPSTPLNETRVGTVKLPSVVRVGVPIFATIAGFTPVPATAYGYTWEVDGVAKGNTFFYIPVAADVGHKIKVLIEDHNTGFSDAIATSGPTGAVLIGASHGPTPVVIGARNVGQQLSVNTSGWVPNIPTVQWYRNGVKLVGQTNDQYTQVAGDRGKKISVRLTTSATGWTTLAKSSSTSIVTGYPLLTSTPFPSVVGVSTFGYTLTANTGGTWGPGTVKLTYQWLAEDKAIPGATHQTLLLGAVELNSAISVRVTGSEAGYATTSKTSAATPDVRLLNFLATSVPVLSGTFLHGSTVTASVAPWTPAATMYVYHWYVEGVLVSSAHAKTYKLPANSAGKTIKVIVIGLRPDYHAQQFASNAQFIG